MTRPFIALGSAPFKETPAKYGERDYRTNARRECDAYIRAIRNYLGSETPGAELEIHVFDGDKGMYLEVVCRYDPDQPESERYARRCEMQAPQTWQEGGVSPPLLVAGGFAR